MATPEKQPLTVEGLRKALGEFQKMVDDGTAEVIHMVQHNVANPEDATGCCAAINKAIRKGELDAVDLWTCPRCGMDWRPRLVAGKVRFWEAQPVVMVWK